jgi:hypothetical protein
VSEQPTGREDTEPPDDETEEAAAGEAPVPDQAPGGPSPAGDTQYLGPDG